MNRRIARKVLKNCLAGHPTRRGTFNHALLILARDFPRGLRGLYKVTLAVQDMALAFDRAGRVLQQFSAVANEKLAA